MGHNILNKMDGVEKISYSAEEMRAKANLQVALMLLLLGDGATTEEKDNWINTNSEKFRIIFEERKSDPEFLRRSTEEPQNLAQELVKEFWPESLKRVA